MIEPIVLAVLAVATIYGAFMAFVGKSRGLPHRSELMVIDLFITLTFFAGLYFSSELGYEIAIFALFCKMVIHQND